MAAFMDAQPKSRASVKNEERNARLLEELLVVSGPALRRQAQRNAASEADGEDALQSAYVAFLRHYKGPAGSSRGAAVADAGGQTLRLEARAGWSAGRRRALSPGSPREAWGRDCSAIERRGPAELAEVEAELSERWEELGRLKRDERRAIVMVALGYSYEEICERYGWTHTKVNRCLVEGRAALREMGEGER